MGHNKATAAMIDTITVNRSGVHSDNIVPLVEWLEDLDIHDDDEVCEHHEVNTRVCAFLQRIVEALKQGE